MNAQELWNEYKQINPAIGDEMDAWAFGAEPDLLAQLVLGGVKTATASAYDLYEADNEPLPQAGSYDVILDSHDEAVCIIEITKVTIVPFREVSADHAFKEGEGDRTLTWWRSVHQQLFRQWFADCGLVFTEDSPIVLEEFRLAYVP
ncbi:ASCH domain-containing protein [Streptococcus caviae]|uniref:ASCH domain-containing protein n=1 Tax=Streptococcus sp. 'caviae' TaxID=1915004 RepID=UPI00094BA6EC|nr:ASCH domain-containing protein [Streptococcus sp. 'caviae']OLN83544.1 RNA-binding protein [Streptococcus sp. 'caviae']